MHASHRDRALTGRAVIQSDDAAAVHGVDKKAAVELVDKNVERNRAVKGARGNGGMTGLDLPTLADAGIDVEVEEEEETT